MAKPAKLDKKKVIIICAIVGGFVLALIVVIASVWCRCNKQKKRAKLEEEKKNLGDEDGEVHFGNDDPSAGTTFDAPLSNTECQPLPVSYGDIQPGFAPQNPYQSSPRAVEEAKGNRTYPY